MNVRLTTLVNNGGCAAKMSPSNLDYILKTFLQSTSSNLLFDHENYSDVGIFDISSELSIVQSLDFHPPIVDNPYDFGQIAVANALSDLYAVGAHPITALNIVSFPDELYELEILSQILTGALDKLNEVNVSLLGGHTISDPTIKYGLAVTGIAKKDELIGIDKAQKEDLLILTKPIGLGLFSTAAKLGLVSPDNFYEAITIMKQLNDFASSTIKKYPVSACTDVTGFGLIGHSVNIAKASRVTLNICFNKIPLLKLLDFVISTGIQCAGSFRNKEFYHKYINQNNLSRAMEQILYDPQTSGGLLICIKPDFANDCIQELREHNYNFCEIIGYVSEYKDNFLNIIQ